MGTSFVSSSSTLDSRSFSSDAAQEPDWKKMGRKGLFSHPLLSPSCPRLADGRARLCFALRGKGERRGKTMSLGKRGPHLISETIPYTMRNNFKEIDTTAFEQYIRLVRGPPKRGSSMPLHAPPPCITALCVLEGRQMSPDGE